MNEHLTIPANIAEMLRQINEMPLHLAELEINVHPKFPQYDRFIRVTGMDTKSKNEYVYFLYEQILKDKTTREEFCVNLPTPQWVVYAETWSYFRDENNEPITLPLKEGIQDNDGIDKRIKAPSYKYMLWLMKYHNAKFLHLIEGYANDFVKAKIHELNAL